VESAAASLRLRVLLEVPQLEDMAMQVPVAILELPVMREARLEE
jgi:hypothetical protein